MKLRTLIRWINKNYPEVLIIRRGSNPDKRVLNLPKNGRVIIDFSCNPKGHGSILSNTEIKYVYKNYEKVIFLFDYKDNRKNLWTLLHELGHHTSVQLKDDTIQNEVNAWEDAFKIGKRLNMQPADQDIKFIQKCLYSYLREFSPEKKHWESVKSLGLMKKSSMKRLKPRINKTPFYVNDSLSRKYFKKI